MHPQGSSIGSTENGSQLLNGGISLREMKKKISFRWYDILIHLLLGVGFELVDIIGDFYLSVQLYNQLYEGDITRNEVNLWHFPMSVCLLFIPSFFVACLSLVTYWREERSKLKLKSWGLLRWACHIPFFWLAPVVRTLELVIFRAKCESLKKDINLSTQLEIQFKRLKKRDETLTRIKHWENCFKSGPQLWFKIYLLFLHLISGRDIGTYGFLNVFFIVIGICSYAWKNVCNIKSLNLCNDQEKRMSWRKHIILLSIAHSLSVFARFISLGALSALSPLWLGGFLVIHLIITTGGYYSLNLAQNRRSSWNIIHLINFLTSSLFSFVEFFTSKEKKRRIIIFLLILIVETAPLTAIGVFVDGVQSWEEPSSRRSPALSIYVSSVVLIFSAILLLICDNFKLESNESNAIPLASIRREEQREPLEESVPLNDLEHGSNIPEGSKRVLKGVIKTEEKYRDRNIDERLNRLIYLGEGCSKLEKEFNKIAITRIQAFPVEVLPDYRKGYTLKADWSTLLEQAASDGDLALVTRYFLKEKSVGARIETGVNALNEACENGHSHIADWLVKNMESFDPEGCNAVHFAVMNCKKWALQFLIENKANLNQVTTGKRWSALRQAVEKDCAACAKLLIDAGCDINLQDCIGQTALHRAIVKNWKVTDKVPDIIAALVSSGRVDWKLKNHEPGFTVFHLAVHHENLRTAKYLLDIGGKELLTERMAGSSSLNALHYVCSSEDFQSRFEMAKLIVDYVVTKLGDQHSIDENGGLSSSRDEQQLLSPTKSLIDSRTVEGITPLLFACSKGDCALIELLVEAGADVCATDNFGNTTLINAARNCRNSSIQLPSNETFTNICQLYGEHRGTWEHRNMMDSYGSLYIICYLIQKGAKHLIGEVDKHGKTIINLLTDDSSVQNEISKFLEDFASSLCYACKNLPTSNYTVFLDGSNESVPLCSSCITKAKSLNLESAMDVSEASTLVNEGPSANQSTATSDDREELVVLPMDQDDSESLEGSSTSGVSSGRSSLRSASSSADSLSASTGASNGIRTGPTDIIQPTSWRITQEKDKNGKERDVLTNDQGGMFTKSNNGKWKCTKQGARVSRKCPATVVEENGKFTLLRNHVHVSSSRKLKSNSSNN